MDYRKILETKYDRAAWETMLHDIFGNRLTIREAYPVDVNHEVAHQAYYLGKIELTDGQMIAIYEVQLTNKVNIVETRAKLRNLLVSQWRNSGYAGAFMLCYRSNESILRFSYVSETYRFDEDHKFTKQSTDTKRYTYLLGEGMACRTAVDRFNKLRTSGQTLNDVTRAFSVEVLTKQFYDELFEWYSWAVSDASGIYFPNDVRTTTDDREDMETKIIRLITRIMFIWFIRQKSLVPAKLFDADFLRTILKNFDPQATDNGNYYNAILQNLFFATLNRAIVDEEGNKRRFAYLKGQRDIKTLYRYAEMFNISEQEVINLFSSVPFLNGGLFECLDKTQKIDGVDVNYNYDGFSRNESLFSNGHYRQRAFVPNILFFKPEKGLFSILNRYNFTIEENTPDDQQVALDPELLGKVFENLLGAYNPETRETARNQSGSFYTPREIVNYMVDESLISYLGGGDAVRTIFNDDFEYQAKDEAFYKEVTDKLKVLKVIDPACGSGAFPMGMLNRIVDILKKLNHEQNVYNLKLHAIENCIYGCDIQSIAAQITKLRFFISLICDCDKDPSKPNFGMPTLPNLETKFVSADSLIALKRGYYVQGNLFIDNEVARLKGELQNVRHQHFMAKTAAQKKRLREKDNALRTQLSQILKEQDTQLNAAQLVKWNPYDQNAVADFFDPEWMFGLKEGFDIVIGNPPYVQLQNNGGVLAQKYEGQGYKVFARTGDEYCLFYERGWQLLKDGGHLCFITSNKWMRAGYGEKTRGFFAKETNPELLIDFAGVKIFESATVDTNILLFAKEKNQGHTICVVTNKENKDSVSKLSLFVRQQHSVCSFNTSDSWVILSPIEQSIKNKIEAVGVPLKDWDINIYRGVLTGCNEAFIISTEKRNEILANCRDDAERKRTEELIRPILRGRDIKRYGYNWAGLWLIATFPARHYDIELYPAIKKYLLSFAEDYLRNNGQSLIADCYLSDFCKQKLAQTGQYIVINGKCVMISGKKEKSRKKTSNKWFETQDSISYWDDFDKPKIIWKIIGNRLGFALENKKMVLNNACYILTCSEGGLEYLEAMLNSNAILWYSFVTNMNKTGVGDMQVGLQNINILPIPKNPKEKQTLYYYVNDLHESKDPSYMTKIESLICKIYGFS